MADENKDNNQEIVQATTVEQQVKALTDAVKILVDKVNVISDIQQSNPRYQYPLHKDSIDPSKITDNSTQQQPVQPQITNTNNNITSSSLINSPTVSNQGWFGCFNPLFYCVFFLFLFADLFFLFFVVGVHLACA